MLYAHYIAKRSQIHQHQHMKKKILTLISLLSIITLSSQKLDFVKQFRIINDTYCYPEYIVVNDKGEITVAGRYSGEMDFDPGEGTRIIRSAQGGMDYFSVTLDSLGNYKSGGGSNNTDVFDRIFGMTIDTSDNKVYAIYKFWNTPRFSISGNGWSRTIPLSHYDNVSFVRCMTDRFSNLYILGKSKQNLVLAAGDTLKVKGDEAAFLIKLTNKNQLLWHHVFNPGSISTDSFDPNTMITDHQGDVIIAGSFTGATPLTDLVGQDTILTSTGKKDPFYVKFSPEGHMKWVKHLRGSNVNADELITDTGVDGQGYLYFTGPNSSNLDYDVGDKKVNIPGASNFVLRVDPEGLYDTVFSLNTRGESAAIRVLKDGSFFLNSRFYVSTDLDPNPNGIYTLKSDYAQDYIEFVAKFSRDGKIMWGKRLKGNGQGSIGAMFLDKKQNLYYCGYLQGSISFDGPNGAIKLTTSKAYLQDGHIEKYSHEVCTSSEKTDYMIKIHTSDIGQEPLSINVPPWNSSGIYKDSPVKDVPVSASKNNIYVNVLNIGCADVQNARLELYHAIPPSDLTWPDGWTHKTININGQDVLISGKLLDIEIPKLKRKDTWTGLYNYKPVNPNLFNKTEMPLNILARIVSPVDKMKEEEGPNTLFNVFSNNNIAWNIFTIIK